MTTDQSPDELRAAFEADMVRVNPYRFTASSFAERKRNDHRAYEFFIDAVAWEAYQAGHRRAQEWRLPEEPTQEQLADACLSHGHDFGLLPVGARLARMNAMREHWRAIWKAVYMPGRGSEFLPALHEGKQT